MNTKNITLISMMAALIFIGTYFFKIPVLVTQGYIHLGDGIIIVGIFLLGWKKGALSASIGAGLADLIGGYAHWILPTVVIKALYVLVIWFIFHKFFEHYKFGWVIASIIGGIVQILGYATVETVLYGWKAALISVSGNTFQVVSAVLVGTCLITVFEKAKFKIA